MQQPEPDPLPLDVLPFEIQDMLGSYLGIRKWMLYFLSTVYSNSIKTSGQEEFEQCYVLDCALNGIRHSGDHGGVNPHDTSQMYSIMGRQGEPGLNLIYEMNSKGLYAFKADWRFGPFLYLLKLPIIRRLILSNEDYTYDYDPDKEQLRQLAETCFDVGLPLRVVYHCVRSEKLDDGMGAQEAFRALYFSVIDIRAHKIASDMYPFDTLKHKHCGVLLDRPIAPASIWGMDRRFDILAKVSRETRKRVLLHFLNQCQSTLKIPRGQIDHAIWLLRMNWDLFSEIPFDLLKHLLKRGLYDPIVYIGLKALYPQLEFGSTPNKHLYQCNVKWFQEWSGTIYPLLEFRKELRSIPYMIWLWKYHGINPTTEFCKGIRNNEYLNKRLTDEKRESFIYETWTHKAIIEDLSEYRPPLNAECIYWLLNRVPVLIGRDTMLEGLRAYIDPLVIGAVLEKINRGE